MLYIDPVECIDCGACCPQLSGLGIFALDDLTRKMERIHRADAKYFGGLEQLLAISF